MSKRPCVGDSGIFIGELTAPVTGGYDFYSKSIKGVFSQYRKEMANSGVKFDSKDTFYEPAGYCMMGNYDLTVLSLIEDFHFSNRHFHPFSFLHSDSNASFNYHLTTGSVCSGDPNYLVDKARQTFLAKDKRYPFIGISNFKIKNSLLIGSGYNVIRLATASLHKLLAKFKRRKDFDYLIFETISWNEIGIIFFANDYQIISDAIVISREINIRFALDSIERNESVELQRVIENNSLLGKIFVKDLDKAFDSHLFSHTFSNLGVDISWLSQVQFSQGNSVIKCKKFKDAHLTSNFHGFIRWFVKPFHLNSFIKSGLFSGDKSGKNDQSFFIVIGNGDIEEKSEATPLEEVLQKLKTFQIDGVDQDISKALLSIRKTKTIPKLVYSIKDFNTLLTRNGLSDAVPDVSSNISEYLRKHYVFTNSQLSKLRRNLISLKVSKTLRERILNAFINYNDGIQDPILYSGFIELQDFLIYIFITICDDLNRVVGNSFLSMEFTSESRHEKYNNWIDSFYHAYEALITHSHRLYGVTDFNLDYNGGIQPILSGYDAVFKFLRNSVEYDLPSRNNCLMPYFCVVTAMPRITSTGSNIKINYNHLFNPEFFLAPLMKEVVNHYFSNIVGTKLQKSPLTFKETLRRISFQYRSKNIGEAYKYLKNFNYSPEFSKSDMVIYLLENAHEYLVSDFKLRLLKEIIKVSEWEEKALMLEYIETIHPATFYYFLEDTFCVRVYGFKNFSQWWWNLYAQESDAYDYYLALDEPMLFRMLLRTSIITLHSKGDEKFVTEIFSKLSDTHASQAGYHWKAIMKFSKILLDMEVIPGFYLKDFLNNAYKTANSIIDPYSRDTTTRPNDNFANAISNGWVTSISLTEMKNLTQLIVAYLEAVQTLFPGSNVLLERDYITGNARFPNGRYIHKHVNDRLLLDPTGGAFTIGKDVRRKYFKLRHTLIKTLFDFSLRYKAKNLFREEKKLILNVGE